MSATVFQQHLFQEIARLAEIDFAQVTRDALLRDLGIDSLMALNLVAFVERRLGVRITEEDIRKVRTPGDILSLVEEASPPYA